MRRSNTVLTAFGILGLMAAPAFAAAHRHTTPASATDLQNLTYEVYAGGVNAVTATLEVADDSRTQYHITLAAQTHGLLGKLAPWRGTFEAQGMRAKDGRLTPIVYKTSSIWHNKNETKQFTFNKDGSFKNFSVQESGQDSSPKSLDPQLTQGTTDELSATMAVMTQVARGGKCEGSASVFDGLRRFKLLFHHQGIDTLTPSPLNVYAGPAVRCTVEVIPDGGKWHVKPRGWMSIQEQGRLKGSLPTVWLAKLSANGPAVPVKIRVLTNYGTLFMQLAGYQNGVKKLMIARPAPDGRTAR